MEQVSVRVALVLLAAAFLASTSTMVAVSARYLPTRGQEDRLERLRELLKDLLESDMDHSRAYPLPEVPLMPERVAVFKRASGLSPYAGTASGRDVGRAALSRNGSPSSSADTILSGGNGLVQIPSAFFDSSYADPEKKVMK